MKIRGQRVYKNKERLQRLSKANPVTNCVEWIGAKRNGYGYLTVGSRSNGTRRSVSAHRLSYEEFVGPIPEGLYVCHKCDNRKCINPDHLFLGTHQDNVDDRERKGRNSPPPIRHGSAHNNAKLTEEDVLKIRASSEMGTPALSVKYGVAKRTIRDVLNGTTWRHLLPAASLPQPPRKPSLLADGTVDCPYNGQGVAP